MGSTIEDLERVDSNIRILEGNMRQFLDRLNFSSKGSDQFIAVLDAYIDHRILRDKVVTSLKINAV